MKAILAIATVEPFSVGSFWDDLKQNEISTALKKVLTKEEDLLQPRCLKYQFLYISFFIIVFRKIIPLAVKMA